MSKESHPIACPFCGNTDGLDGLDRDETRTCRTCDAILRLDMPGNDVFGDIVCDMSLSDRDNCEICRGNHVETLTDFLDQDPATGDRIYVFGLRRLPTSST
jgi:hypothetical protein